MSRGEIVRESEPGTPEFYGMTQAEVDELLGAPKSVRDLPKWARSAWERRGRRRRLSPTKREMVYRRDGFKCVQCGTSLNLTLDHKIPLAKGGTNYVHNLQTMCQSCNHEKGCS